MLKERAHKEFREYLKSEKHRITPERFEVLDAALDYSGHFGADDLYVEMKTEKSNVSRATVYNTLELLAKSELIAKRNFGDGKAHFEANFEKKYHDHLICTTCGSIKEFFHPDIKNIVSGIGEELGFENSGYSFTIFGKCKDPQNCKGIKK